MFRTGVLWRLVSSEFGTGEVRDGSPRDIPAMQLLWAIVDENGRGGGGDPIPVVAVTVAGSNGDCFELFMVVVMCPHSNQ